MLKNFKMVLTVIGISLFTVAITPNVAEAEFTPLCSDITLAQDERFLSADCNPDEDEDGEWKETYIDLSKIIERDRNGRLRWKWNGDYTRYCDVSLIHDYQRNHTILKGRCDVPNIGRQVNSQLDLDERIILLRGGLIYVSPG